MSETPSGCRHAARDLLSFYLNGTLLGEEEATVRAHIQSCAPCASELNELSELAQGIEAYGIDASAGQIAGPAQVPRQTRGRFPATRALGIAAGLILSVSVAAYWTYLRVSERPPAPAGPLEARLDLGAGPLRSGGSPPTVAVTPGLRTLIVSFFPPVQPGASYRVGLVEGSGRTVLPDAPLARLDEVGRATLPIPAGLLDRSDSYVVVLRVEPPGGGSLDYRYTFAVTRSGERP